MEIPFIDIHTHRASTTLCSFGIHPWWFDDQDYHVEHDMETLDRLLQEGKLAAIGETGIDRLHKDTVSLQLACFERHILLSEQYLKPMIIHQVKATGDILQLHKKYRPEQAWIIHGFNGTENEARQLSERGIYLSVGESLFHENRKIVKSIKSIPLDRLFFETDISERSIQEIYGKAAVLLNLPLDLLKAGIFANFARLNIALWKTGKNAPDGSSVTMALRNLGRVTF